MVVRCTLFGRLRHNPNLVYTILIEKESFSVLADFSQFASEVENINIVVSYFERRLERIDDNSVLSVAQVCPPRALSMREGLSFFGPAF